MWSANPWQAPSGSILSSSSSFSSSFHQTSHSVDIMLQIFPLLISAHLFPFVAFAIDRDVCYQNIINDVNSTILDPNNRAIFYSPALADPTIPLSLTLPGCYNLCGSWTWYSYEEFASRATTWLLPILLMVGNMHSPPLEWTYFLFPLLHLVGDPIDTILSLLHTLQARRCHMKWAETQTFSNSYLSGLLPKDLATVISAIDTLNAGFKPDGISSLFSFPFSREVIVTAAQSLRSATVDESIRTSLAMLTYLASVISAFYEAATDTSAGQTRPGNRVAFAMLFSWLIPAMLLSTVAKRFCETDSCTLPLQHLVDSVIVKLTIETTSDSNRQHAQPTSNFEFSTENPSLGYQNGESSNGVFVLQYILSNHQNGPDPTTGTVYTFRPRKPLLRDSDGTLKPLCLLALALLPVLISFGTAVALSYNTPTKGFGCRFITHLSITLAWLLSFITTTLLERQCVTALSPHIRLKIVAAKDALIGLSALTMVTLIYAGLYNSCWCWSNGLNGAVSHDLFVLVGVDSALQGNAKDAYPTIVGVCLGIQLLHLVVMMTDRWIGKVRILFQMKDRRAKRRRGMVPVEMIAYRSQRSGEMR
ncbi:hypothetical protein K469DRAFT_748848 [Zopfia rhizophila CBS 207.26]|uniref:Uncharacterized protein n=1 Tax=Zopfia rhizophila CBS 207.26 TaxID=1314779 RepID=A0A6A6E6L8_9PEZI|nr:hypothetical protein K469DRAFT_748848 [Zopfia rhizophila CBS 207.26]